MTRAPGPNAQRCSIGTVSLVVLLSLVAVQAHANGAPATGPATKYALSQVATLTGPSDVTVAFSRDGKKILTAGGTECRVWDAATFEPVTPPLDLGEKLAAAAFDDAGHHVLAVGKKSVRVWDSRTGKFASPRLHHDKESAIHTARISPDGERILTVADEPPPEKPGIQFRGVNAPLPRTNKSQRTVYVWDRKTGEQCLALEHESFVNFAGFSPDGKKILTMCAELYGLAHLWDARTGEPLMEPVNDVISGSPAAAFSRDSTRFALTGWYRVTVHSATDGQRLYTNSDFDREDLMTGVAMTPDGSAVLARKATGLHVWNIKTEKQVGKAMEDIFALEEGLEFDAEGRTAFMMGRGDDGAGLWDIEQGERLWAVPKESGPIRGVRFAADGSLVLGKGGRASAQIYKLVR